MWTEEQKQVEESKRMQIWKNKTRSEGRLGWSNEGTFQGASESGEEARLEQARLHSRETRASESGEQTKGG